VTHSHASRVALVVPAAAAYAWVAAGQQPFTLAQEMMVALPALAVLVVALSRPSWSGPSWSGPSWSGGAGTKRGSTVPWVVLFVMGAAWELIAFFASPRADRPTLSSFADDAMGTHAGRAVMFLLWLALGWSLVKRRAVRP